jgi:hypothetical protein
MSIKDKFISIAEKIRELLGVVDKMSLDMMPVYLTTCNEEIVVQSALLDEAIVELRNKATNGSSNLGTISVFPSSEAKNILATDFGYDGFLSVNVPGETNLISENIKKGIVLYEGVDGYEIIGTYEDTNSNNQLHASLDGTLTTINSDVTKVIGYACRDITTLVTVSLPNATSIGTYAFYGCTNLDTIMANNITSIGSSAFYKCGKLKSISFPKLGSILASCFYQCTQLNKADFWNVASIASNAFYYCSNLDALILRKTDSVVTLSATSALSQSKIVTGAGYIYVPSALIDTYKTSTNWASFSSKFRAIEDYPDICG